MTGFLINSKMSPGYEQSKYTFKTKNVYCDYYLQLVQVNALSQNLITYAYNMQFSTGVGRSTDFCKHILPSPISFLSSIDTNITVYFHS